MLIYNIFTKPIYSKKRRVYSSKYSLLSLLFLLFIIIIIEHIIINIPTTIDPISSVLLNISFFISIEYTVYSPFSAITFNLTVENAVNSLFPNITTSALLLVGTAVIIKLFSFFIFTLYSFCFGLKLNL